MRAAMMLVAALVAVPLTGCVLDTGRSTAHVSAGVSLEVEHDYTYFPSHQAYFCESCDEWWIEGSGGWIRTSVRPARIVIEQDTPWLSVRVGGPDVQVRFTEYARANPSGGKGHRGKGPPPGRGWRK